MLALQRQAGNGATRALLRRPAQPGAVRGPLERFLPAAAPATAAPVNPYLATDQSTRTPAAAPANPYLAADQSSNAGTATAAPLNPYLATDQSARTPTAAPANPYLAADQSTQAGKAAAAPASPYVVGVAPTSTAAVPAAAATPAGKYADPAANQQTTKYKGKDRLAGYEREFTQGSVHTPELVEDVRGMPEPQARAWMKGNYGWTDADFDEFVPKVLGGANPNVKALDEVQREEYRLTFSGSAASHDGVTATNGHVEPGPPNGTEIFVMTTNGEFYSAPQKVGLFHHSSFLAGAAVGGAGEMTFSGGTLKAINNASGHYEPRAEEAIQVMAELGDGALKAVPYEHYYEKGGASVPYRSAWSDFYLRFKDDPSQAPRKA